MSTQNSEVDRQAVGWAMRWIVGLAFLTAFAVTGGILPIIPVSRQGTVQRPANRPIFQIVLNTPVPLPTTIPATPTPHIPHVGIIAGHTGSDSGATCPDGLQEVDINRNIAQRVVALLRKQGWQVDLLQEFDPRLDGYKADALLSIHADSCNVPGKSGFKVASAESGYAQAAEHRMVACISKRYEERTGLQFDPNTITYDMTRYHAYYEIDHHTPAAIIETGFMLDDRELLVERPDVVAQGIADGLKCFINGETP